jgi:predicted GH43/DUF377 family glycosyl hydrolase
MSLKVSDKPMKSRYFSTGLLGLLASVTAALLPAPSSAAEDKVFFLTNYHEMGDGLHLSYSKDGDTWTDLDRVFLKPEVGGKLFRDGHVLQGPDGLYHLVWTSGMEDKGIGYATSKDLIHWSEQKFLPLMEQSTATHCWAPETFYDSKEKQYLLYWSSDVKDGNRCYYVTTKDFKSFSEPKLLFDPGYDNFDATLRQSNGKYVIAFRANGGAKPGSLALATSSSLLGTYEVQPGQLNDLPADGPSLVDYNGGTLLIARGSNGKTLFRSTKDWQTWQETLQPYMPPQHSQGTAFIASRKVLDGIFALDADQMAAAPKPILPGYYADPAIRVFGDTYYVYPTHEKDKWFTTDFYVWSSKDLIHWERHPMAMDIAHDLKWGKDRAWAPDCVEKNGKYFFYFCANERIGVASGDSPVGPFKDILGRPYIERSDKIKCFPIDPCPFIDDDGQAYLYFGNGSCYVAKLKEDMVNFESEPQRMKIDRFFEGCVVFKRKGKYYFMWSKDDARSPGYHLEYGTADSPMGPVTLAKDYNVLNRKGVIRGPGHHGVINIPGTDRWYVVYHRHSIPDGSGYQREVCLARMEFNDDGTIKPIDPMVSPFAPDSKGEPLVNGKGKP